MQTGPRGAWLRCPSALRRPCLSSLFRLRLWDSARRVGGSEGVRWGACLPRWLPAPQRAPAFPHVSAPAAELRVSKRNVGAWPHWGSPRGLHGPLYPLAVPKGPQPQGGLVSSNVPLLSRLENLSRTFTGSKSKCPMGRPNRLRSAMGPGRAASLLSEGVLGTPCITERGSCCNCPLGVQRG